MKRVLCIVVGLAIAIPVVARQDSAVELFNRGLLLERAEGRLNDAVVLYERVVREFPDDRETVPQALLHLSRVYERQRDPRSISMLVRLADSYPSTSYGAEARRRLTTLQTVEPFKAQPIDLGDGVLNRLGSGPLDFSPDGRLVAFVKAPMPGSTQRVWSLHLRELGGRRAEQVLIDASPTQISGLSFSRDSRRIAVGFAAGPQITRRLSVLTLDSSAAVLTVPSQGGLNWSPDSQWLPYQAPTGQPNSFDALLLNVRTGESRSLGVTVDAPADFRWSRDGATLVFWATPANAANQEVQVVTMATGATRRVVVHRTDANPADTATSWTFQLGKLTTSGELVVWKTPSGTPQARRVGALVALNGGEMREICNHTPKGGCWDVSSDGKSVIVIDDATQRLFLRNTTTGVDQPIIWSTAEESRSTYRSPDDRLLVFFSNRDGAWGIYATLLDQGPVTAPVRLASVDGPPAVSTAMWWGADTLVLRSNVEESRSYRLSMDVATGRPTGALQQIAADLDYTHRPVVSPDGKRIAVLYRKGLRSGLALLDASGRFEKSLLETYRFVRNNEWPPFEWRSNDDLIAADMRSTAATPSLVSINVVTGRTVPLPHAVLDTRDWRYVPGRDELLYLRDRAGERPTLTARSLATGETRVLLSIENPNQEIADFQVGTKGAEVAYLLQGATAGCMSVPCQLRVVSIDGTNDRVVATARTRGQSWGGIQAFSPDGRFLTSLGQIVRTDTGERQPLVAAGQLPGGAAMVPVEGGSFMPDGSAVFVSIRTVRHEIRRWEGFSADAVARLLKR
jgi:Tol biopolymer transport system component